MPAKSKEIQGPGKKEWGKETGVGNAQVTLLQLLPSPYSCAEHAITS